MQATRLVRSLGLFACLFACSAGVVAAAPATGRRAPLPAGAQQVDLSQRIDANDVSMALTNVGSFAFDYSTGLPGLEYPKGSGRTAVYSSGLWLSAKVGTSARHALSGYAEEFMAGAAPGGIDDDPGNPDYKVYKLHRTYASSSERDAVLADYNAHAVTHGAPPVSLLSDGSLAIPGEQMCWSVYNDVDPSNHQNPAGSTSPLRVEVQQTTFAYADPGAFRNTVFVRFKLINRYPLSLTDMYVGFWADPDLGDPKDDLTGSDPATGLGFCYNAANNDSIYGAAPPAIGYDMVQGPFDTVSGHRLGATTFSRFINGADPDTSTETTNVMRGLSLTGTPLIDPVEADTTRFMFCGDPVAATGWNDLVGQDERMLLTAGPFTMAPGSEQEVVLAIILAQGSDRLNSLALLRTYDAVVQSAFDTSSFPVLGVDAPTTSTLALNRAFPNPSRGSLTLAFTLPASAPATLEVVDLAGRRAFSQAVGAFGIGRHELSVGTSANRLPAGMYFVRLSQSGRTATSRLVVLP
jgi:hypothetical protein